MPRLVVLFAGIVLATALSATAAEAANNCQRATGGKCGVGQNAPSGKTTSGAVTKKQTWQKRSGSKSRNDYSVAEREKMMQRARQICSKEFGKPSRVYRIDYKQGRVWCTPASY